MEAGILAGAAIAVLYWQTFPHCPQKTKTARQDTMVLEGALATILAIELAGALLGANSSEVGRAITPVCLDSSTRRDSGSSRGIPLENFPPLARLWRESLLDRLLVRLLTTWLS